MILKPPRKPRAQHPESSPVSNHLAKESQGMRVYVGRIVGVLLALLGFAVLLYPTAASWVHQYTQSTLTGKLHAIAAKTEPAGTEQLDQAHRYNKALQAGARLAPNTNVPSAT